AGEGDLGPLVEPEPDLARRGGDGLAVAGDALHQVIMEHPAEERRGGDGGESKGSGRHAGKIIWSADLTAPARSRAAAECPRPGPRAGRPRGTSRGPSR